MNEPEFLDADFIKEIHELALARWGGIGGVRDEALLESAISAAESVYLYGGGDMFDIAAAYCFHIAESQAFMDGNKRTAVGASFAFLDHNGIDTSGGTEGVLYDAVIAVAKHEIGRKEVAILLREQFGGGA